MECREFESQQHPATATVLSVSKTVRHGMFGLDEFPHELYVRFFCEGARLAQNVLLSRTGQKKKDLMLI